MSADNCGGTASVYFVSSVVCLNVGKFYSRTKLSTLLTAWAWLVCFV